MSIGSEIVDWLHAALDGAARAQAPQKSPPPLAVRRGPGWVQPPSSSTLAHWLVEARPDLDAAGLFLVRFHDEFGDEYQIRDLAGRIWARTPVPLIALRRATDPSVHLAAVLLYLADAALLAISLSPPPPVG